MAELADALASGASLSNQVQVQVLFRGPSLDFILDKFNWENKHVWT